MGNIQTSREYFNVCIIQTLPFLSMTLHSFFLAFNKSPYHNLIVSVIVTHDNLLKTWDNSKMPEDWNFF